MYTSRPHLLPLLLLAAATLQAQTPTQTLIPTPRKPRTLKSAAPLFNSNVILIDPAHGGSDPGTTLAPGLLEKDATLALAKTLRTLLTARGFTVMLTHEYAATPVAPAPRPAPPADATPEQLEAFAQLPPVPAFNPNANNPQPDIRAEQSNRTHAAACLIIHATPAGRGVHLYTSALTPSSAPLDPDPLNRPIIPWDAAQAASLPYSARLASDLAAALAGARIPILTGHISTRPIDSLTCPALTLELAPLDATSPADSAYQLRIAQTMAAALDTWRAHALPPAPPTPATPIPAEKPKTRTRPARVPTESPVSLPAPTGAPK